MRTTKSIQIVSFVALAWLSGVVACGKKGGDDASEPAAVRGVCDNVPVGTYGTDGRTLCVGAVGPGVSTGGNILNRVKFETPHLVGEMSIMGLNAVDLANTQVYATYTGPVSINGFFDVKDSTYCNAPVGRYILSSVTNAQFSPYYTSGILASLDLLAVGQGNGGNILLKSNGVTSVVYNPNGLSRDAGGNAMFLNVAITVNGSPCGIIQTY